MPILVPNNTVPRDRTGAGTSTSTGGNNGVPIASITPIQVAGLIPLYECDAEDCRVNPIQPCVIPLMVFAGDDYLLSDIGTYENDCNSWLVDTQLYTANTSATAAWVIQKDISGTWTNQASLNNTTYGQYWAFGSNTVNPTYTGVRVNWGKIYNAFGRGYYRIRLSTTAAGLEDCMATPSLWLRPFDCEDAHGTTKFETYLSGQIGAYGYPGKTFNLCGFLPANGKDVKQAWYDSVRHQGFFGYEKISEYQEVQNEYQNGRIETVKDEAIQTFEWYSGLLAKDYHDRLKVYMMMADARFVSDYNINNSDYNLNKLPIVKAGGYEPTYYDKHWNQTQKVTVKFKAGYQSLIKSICCPTLR